MKCTVNKSKKWELYAPYFISSSIFKSTCGQVNSLKLTLSKLFRKLFSTPSKALKITEQLVCPATQPLSFIIISS